MKMKLFAVPFFTLLLSFGLVSCSDENSTEVITESTTNKVATTTGNNSFTFASTMEGYNYSSEFVQFFNTDSLKVELAVGNYKYGTGKIQVFSTDTVNAIYTADLALTQSVVKYIKNGIPKKIKVNIGGYTGNIAFTLKNAN